MVRDVRAAVHPARQDRRMADPNVLDDAAGWDVDRLGTRARRLGAAAGGRELGLQLFELEPGAATSPYHLHHGNEELLVVLEGRPSVRTPAGLRALEPGAVVAFPAGPEGAHRVVNRSDAPARVLLASTLRYPEVVEHPETGATFAMTAAAEGHVFPAGTDIPFTHAYVEGLRAGLDGDAAAAGS